MAEYKSLAPRFPQLTGGIKIKLSNYEVDNLIDYSTPASSISTLLPTPFNIILGAWLSINGWRLNRAKKEYGSDGLVLYVGLNGLISIKDSAKW